LILPKRELDKTRKESLAKTNKININFTKFSIYKTKKREPDKNK
jgi:hypothetical protein